MAGFFTVQRGWMDHPIFGSPSREPLSRHAAWLWLVEHAAYRPTTVKIEGRMVELARGELSVSIRDMGGRWGWPTTKVARFVSELFQHRFIGTKKIGRQFVITICEYEQFSYQKDERNSSAETKLERSWNDFVPDTRAVIEPVEIREIREGVGSLRSPTARENPDTFEVWYALYPHKVGRADAKKKYRIAMSRASPEVLLDGLRRYIESKPPDRKWCNPAVWLHQERWLDQPAENDGAIADGRAQHRATSPGTNLFEGAFRAAERFERRAGDSGANSAPDEPLLDRLGSRRIAASTDRGLVGRPD